MSGSLGDALKQAGLKSSEPEKKSRGKNARQGRPGGNRPAGNRPAGNRSEPKPPKVKPHDHHHRSDCELCGKNAPDVERYDHTNRSIDAYWLCLPCADRLCIPDSCRQTAQSDFSMRKMFTRQYGRTQQM